MLTALHNIYSLRQINYSQPLKPAQRSEAGAANSALTMNNLNHDAVQFTGKSLPSQYVTVFDYLASEILGRNKRVDGSLLSATKISNAIDNLFSENKVFTDFKRSLSEKIKWKSYIPQDIRTFSIDKINKAREVRLKEWENFLRYPAVVSERGEVRDPELVMKIRNDNSLKLVIWDAVTSEIKENNRHIPVPFNEKALLETIHRFERYDAKDRATACAKPSFLEVYTHRLRDNLLMDMDLSNNKNVWVKIPSIKHDFANKGKNISNLEILSCKNWCTRSSVDKAEDALGDGDFYLYLKRNSLKLWEPLVGMTTLKGKIDQIQGIENNNIVPVHLVDTIKSYISKQGLQCASGVLDEGPKAMQALMISEKLGEHSDVFGKTFFKAIKDKDDRAMFEFLNVPTRILPNGGLEIGNYKPQYVLKADSGIVIPYSMFGLYEDDLLRNVRVINGNLILHNKNNLFNSSLTTFPPKLEKVKGRVVCSAQQYEKFKDDINRVIDNDSKRLFIRGK